MSNFNFGNAPLGSRKNIRNCPKCGKPLNVVTEKRIVGSSSTVHSSHPIGMKVYNTWFSCPACRYKYSEQDLWRLERQKRNEG